MAKRFIDTEMWKKQWYRKLSPIYKCLWTYIFTDCNYAGIWDVDFDLASFQIGEQIDAKKAEEIFSEHIIKVDNCNKWFIKDFVKFQHGEKINGNSLFHKKICEILKKYSHNNRSLFELLNGRTVDTPTEGVSTGEKVVVIVEEEIVEEKEKKEDVKEKSQNEEVNLWPSFDDFWNLYDKKVDRQSCEIKWMRLKQKDKEAIMGHLPHYIFSTPDKQFRKDPETYLNRKSWENEIIQNTTKAVQIETSEDRYKQRLSKFSSVLNKHNHR
jgi:hypothetical protein